LRQIYYSWVSYINDGGTLAVSGTDRDRLDFGNVPLGEKSSTQFLGLRFMGCPVGEIKLWMPGAYADICKYSSSGVDSIAYEQDITVDPHNIRVLGKVVNSPEDPIDAMPTSKTDALTFSGVSANYVNDGYSSDVLALQIDNTSGTAEDCVYTGLRVLLSFDTVIE
jgi:hypothetical protein